MGAGFAHNGTKAITSRRFRELFVTVCSQKKDFLSRYVTMDETWIHHFTPESKRQSAEWRAAGESRRKRPKTQQSAGKAKTSVFWDAHGIIYIDYLEKGKYINSDYYIELLVHLKDEIAKKRLHMKKKKLIFRQDNAPYIYRTYILAVHQGKQSVL